MMTTTDTRTFTFLRNVFPTWWIGMPPDFEEAYVTEDGYWHAWDDHRSISLTSVLVDDPDRPAARIPASEIAAAIPAPEGVPVPVPPGFEGWAVEVSLAGHPKAGSAISSLLAVDGRVLLVTITADDMAWAAGILGSIEYSARDEPPRPPVAGNRAMRRASARRHN